LEKICSENFTNLTYEVFVENLFKSSSAEVEMKAHTMIKLERILRPALKFLSSEKRVEIYSQGRKRVLEALSDEVIERKFSPSRDFETELWGIKFRSPIMNAAGMFKNGECYELMAKQGAGAYLGGTTTALKNSGNTNGNIVNPFITLPKSNSAINWLGLPNNGDEFVLYEAKQISKMKRSLKCPVGWSLAYQSNFGFNPEKQMEMLVRSIKDYSNVGVDFLEINESCPNTGENNINVLSLGTRLLKLKQQIPTKKVPIIVKFSNDIDLSQVGGLMELLIDSKYDGVNFGNTSTNYELHRNSIDEIERKDFDYFTSTLGGGISGKPLKEKSLELCTEAVKQVRRLNPNFEFNVIRTGGIDSAEDILDSKKSGILMNQWFTGYWENFGKSGHDVYKELYGNLERLA